MIILLTDPEERKGEGELLNRMLAAHPELIVHVRKPEMERAAYEQALQAIDPAFHPRIVLHQHHDLSDAYAVKGVHFTEHDRATHAVHPKVVSTSFHTHDEALKSGKDYMYFFCSPVLPSISKHGYAPSEDWTIIDDPAVFRAKAVALGGIETGTLAAVRAKGFQHVAVLGTVWQASDPQRALDELFAANG